MKKNIFFILIILLLTFSGCSGNNEITTEIPTEIPTEISEPESTTLNQLPDNEFEASRKSITIPEFNPDYSKPAETNLNDDGSSYKTFDINNKDYHDITYYNADGSVSEHRKETYTSAGLLDCIYVYDNDMTFLYCCAREYDSLNRFYRYYYYNKDAELACCEVLDYDGFGNQSGPFVYDADGNMIEEYPELY